MRGILYYKKDQKIHSIVEDVQEASDRGVFGAQISITGVDWTALDLIVLNDDEAPGVKENDALPAGLTDKRSLIEKATIDDLGKEVYSLKLKIIAMEGGSKV